MGLLLFSPGGVFAAGLILIAGISFGLIFESQIPLILGMMPSDRAGLATGLYFGGISAASAIVSMILQGAVAITPIGEFFWCGTSFAIVLLCFAKS
jgi:hypothetical protein